VRLPHYMATYQLRYAAQDDEGAPMTSRHDRQPPHTGAAERPRPADEPSEVDLLMRLSRRLRKGVAVETAPWGLSPHQARALLAVARHTDAPPRLSELAARLDVTPRSATEVVDALAEHGLVERSPDPADRRAVRLVVTQRGGDVVTQIRAARQEVGRRAMGVLTDEERAQLRAVVTKLLDSLDT
jgi:DNA-binding MarR family transcriptional regulator